MKILIDNGHGINTPGKRSPDGTLREYALTRRIVDRLTALHQDAALDTDDIIMSIAKV